MNLSTSPMFINFVCHICSSVMFISLRLSQNSNNFHQNWIFSSSQSIQIVHEVITHVQQLCSSARFIITVHQPIPQPNPNRFQTNFLNKLSQNNIKWIPVHQPCSSIMFISLYLIKNSAMFIISVHQSIFMPKVNIIWMYMRSALLLSSSVHQLCSSSMFIETVHQPIFWPKPNRF